jgi:hypothetical protein
LEHDIASALLALLVAFLTPEKHAFESRCWRWRWRVIGLVRGRVVDFELGDCTVI